MVEKLEPCPFCGGEAKLAKGYYRDQSWVWPRIICRDSACGGSKQAIQHPWTEAEAIAAWNQRTPAGIGPDIAPGLMSENAPISDTPAGSEPAAWMYERDGKFERFTRIETPNWAAANGCTGKPLYTHPTPSPEVAQIVAWLKAQAGWSGGQDLGMLGIAQDIEAGEWK